MKIRLRFRNWRASGDSGFALVLCLSVMALLAALAMMLLGLAQRQTQRIKYDDAISVARANARLALKVAISQLQYHAGRDQTMTSQASLLDTRGVPTADLDPAILHPFYTVAYQSSEHPAERGLFLRKVDQLGSVLVSGNEAYDLSQVPVTQGYPKGYTTPQTSLPPDRSVVLLDLLDPSIRHRQIAAPLVTLSGQRGAYAYWVGDEGVKARVNLNDPYREKNNDLASNAQNIRENFYSLMAPSRLAVELAGNQSNQTQGFMEFFLKKPTWVPQLLSSSSISLAGNLQSSARKRHFSDFTVTSRSVLSDSQNGGLKKNFTAAANLDNSQFLELLNHTGAEAQQASPVFLYKRFSFPAENVDSVDYKSPPGLAWDVFRSHLRRGEWEMGQLNVTDPLSGPRPQVVSHFGTPVSQLTNYWETGATNADGMRARLIRRTPILSRFQLSVDYTASYDGVVTDSLTQEKWHEYSLRQHIIPLVIFWNPYNVDLKITEKQGFSFYANRDYGTGKLNTRFTLTPSSTDPVSVFGLAIDEYTRADASGNSIDNRPFWMAPRTNAFDFLYPYFSTGNLVGNRYHLTQYATVLPEYIIPAGSSAIFGVTDNNRPYTHTGAVTLTKVDNINKLTGRSTYTKNAKIRVKYTDANANSWRQLIPSLTIRSFPSHQGETRCDASSTASFQRTNWNVNSVIGPAAIRFVPVLIGDNDPIPQSDSNGVESPKFAMTLIRKHPNNDHYFPNSTNIWMPTSGVFDTNRYLAPWMSHYNYSASRHGAYGAAQGQIRAFSAPPLYMAGIIVGRSAYDLIYPEATLSGEAFTGYSDTLLGGSNKVITMLQPRQEIPTLSIGHFSGVDCSKWVQAYTADPSFASSTDAVQPTVAIGNSFASPHLPINRSHTKIFDNTSYGGAAAFATQYDASFRYNQALWDRYFLTGERAGEINNVSQLKTAIPNAVLEAKPDADLTKFKDPHFTAGELWHKGAFNVNSTSVEAWKTVLASTLGLKTSSTDQQDSKLVPFPRLSYVNASPVTSPPADFTDKTYYDGTRYRALTIREIETLAQNIVIQNKLRGPYATLSQFVNRSLEPSLNYRSRVMGLGLSADQVSYEGPLQAAINASGINGVFNTSNANYPPQLGVTNENAYTEYEAGRINPKTLKYHSGFGNPATLMQSDVLARMGHLLTNRSDTFTVRAYGEAHDASGKVIARAWCEATVQRFPEYVNAVDPAEAAPYRWTPSGLFTGTWAPNTSVTEVSRRLGRRFQVVSFRWLNSAADV